MRVLITNPWHSKIRMIRVNEGFEEQTGWTYEGTPGRHCQFPQGAHAYLRTIEATHTALDTRRTSIFDTLSYRTRCMTFMNGVQMQPRFDKSGRLRYFVGTRTQSDRQYSDPNKPYQTQMMIGQPAPDTKVQVYQEGPGFTGPLKSLDRYLSLKALRNPVTRQ